MSALSIVAGSLATIILVQRLVAYRNVSRTIQHLPGPRIPIAPQSIIGLLMNRIPGIWSVLGLTLSSNIFFEWKHDLFTQYPGGWDILAAVTVLPYSTIFVFIADAAAAKEVTTYRTRFPKPVEFYETLSAFGRNIVVSEGEEWKKYRKISAPAFTERNNRLVWEETIKVMEELFDEVWKDKESVTVDNCLDLTLPMALFVIGSAGFGRTMSWLDGDDVPAGHTMSFKQSMETIGKDFFLPLIVPKWAMGVTSRTAAARDALAEMRAYMSEMIHGRLHSDKVERNDLFNILLEENSQHMDSAALTDQELFGNIFIFLIAGHETTSHSLAFALGLLALYPDEQEKMYQQVKSVLKDGRKPTYEDVSLLSYSLAVFLEALRMFPAVTSIPKVAAEDTVLTTSNLDGEVKTIPIPKGAYINISVPGLHYNPRYWADPKTFKPSRFLEPDWPRDAFIPFSSGARACIGRRFAEVEAIAILTMFVSKYIITVKEDPRFVNESFEERKARVLASGFGITLTPLGVPLTFTRR